MRAKTRRPERLYKFRGISAQTIDLVVADRIYYAAPTSFNDPLDTKPSVHADLSSAHLKTILRNMAAHRVRAEMSAAARAIKYRGPKTLAHIESHSTLQAEKLLKEAEYYATNPDYGPPDAALKEILTQHIQNELLARYGKGVFSLGSRFSCPLMWSHYGDQHKGLCLGYLIPDAAKSELHQVSYGGTRLIATSIIGAMLEGDVEAQKEVDNAVLLRKASEWRYEKEWRHLGPIGLAESPLELVDITFGLRCPRTVKHAVIAALTGRAREVKFYEMTEVTGTFSLKRKRVNVEELLSSYPARALTGWEMISDFEDL